MSEVEAGVEGRAWTRREVELVVNVHLHTLRMQLMGQTPNKAEHNRQLQTMLPARSKASIEYKHCNISAVLVELGVPPLAGYRPPFNYQQLLVPVVSEAIGRDALLTKPRFVRSRHLPRRRCWIRSNVSSLCRPKAKSFQRCCVERRGRNRQHPQGPFAGFGNGAYLAGRLALCVLLDSRCLASMSPAQRAALDRTQFNDFRCCSLAA